MRKGFREKVTFEQRPAGGLGKEPWGLREMSQERGQQLGSAQPPWPLQISWKVEVSFSFPPFHPQKRPVQSRTALDTGGTPGRQPASCPQTPWS